MAEKCEETVYEPRVSIVADRLERAELIALGLSTRVRTGQPWVKPGNDKEDQANASVHSGARELCACMA
jgi:hypothetical protein